MREAARERYARVLATLICFLTAVTAVGLTATDAFARPIGYLYVAPTYGEFVDVGEYRAHLSLTRNGGGVGAIMYRLVCDPRSVTVAKAGSDIRVTVMIELGDELETGYPRCVNSESIGELTPGTYTVTADFIDRSGQHVDTDTQIVNIESAGGKCNTNPALNSVIVLHKSLTADQLRTAAKSDPAMDELLSHPLQYHDMTIGAHHYAVLYYPPLESPIVIAGKMWKSGQFLNVETNSMFCFSPYVDTIEPAIEFFNAQTGHYFYTSQLPEIAAVERGAAGQGWTRTGMSFNTITNPGCPVPDPGKFGPVYRFYGGQQTGGPNSHFMTISRQECHAVKSDSRWGFESTPFWASTPVASTCASKKKPLYRAYNDRWRENDSNHRFSTEPGVIQQMVQQGWIDEGIVMCVER